MNDTELLDRLRLIRDGATLVQDVDDVLTILAQVSKVEAPPAEPHQIPPAQLVPLSEKQKGEIHKKLLENISHDPIAVDELCRWCHVSADIVQSFLLELELAG